MAYRDGVDVLRLPVRVTPGASRTRVGGRWAPDGAEPHLVVTVRERAVDGRATEAVRRALAAALGVPARSVRLVRGATSRAKVFEVDPADDAVRTRAAALLDGPGGA